MLKRKIALARAIKTLAVLTLLAFVYALVRASLYYGETHTVGIANLVQTLILYLIAFILAILSGVYFIPYSGFGGIKIFSILVAIVYGYSMFSFPFKFGDTLEWTPGYLSFTLVVFSLGFILAIWTMLSFRKLTNRQQLKNT